MGSRSLESDFDELLKAPLRQHDHLAELLAAEAEHVALPRL